jgi:hypothetical protein
VTQSRALVKRIYSVHKVPTNTILMCSDALEGRIQIVCVCPETLNQDHWRDALLSPAWRDSVQAIVFDEVHMLDEGPFTHAVSTEGGCQSVARIVTGVSCR